MTKFVDKYLNIKNIIESKKEYRSYMARVRALPEDYQYVYKKIQETTWSFACGDGLDMVELHYGLVELFESGAAEGKSVLEVTGEDVGAFVEELLKNVKTYTGGWRDKLNHDIARKV